MASLFEQISSIAHPDNHPQLRAKFEVTWESKFSDGKTIRKYRDFMAFGTQTEARNYAKAVNGLYQVVMYVKGVRLVIFEKQY